MRNVHFGNSQGNPFLNPKLKFSSSSVVLTLKFKISWTYRGLLAYYWARYLLHSVSACCSRARVLWPCCQWDPPPGSLQAPLVCAGWALGRGGWMAVARSPCLCKAERSREGAAGRLTTAKRAEQNSRDLLIWHHPLNSRVGFKKWGQRSPLKTMLSWVVT